MEALGAIHFHVPDLIDLITVPLFTGVIGWIINWTGVLMLFNPVKFYGWRVPGLKPLAALLPRKLQEIPGIMHGGLGWQGIIPSRAARMGSIAVDLGIAKLGSVGEFYHQLEPEKIAEHILATSRKDMRDLVERIMEREHPDLWANLPPRAKDLVHRQVQAQLPEIVRSVTDQIGRNIDQLLDIKLMVIRRMEADPSLANRIFLDVGKRELRLMVNFGFLFGLGLGIPLVFIAEAIGEWWALPIGGVIVGWVTNLMAMQLIFAPVEPRRILGIKFHGLFLRRQSEVADIYSKIIAEDIVTLRNIGEELLGGPRADRTRKMIEDAMRPAVDGAVGPMRGAVRVAVGSREYDKIRESVATEAVEYTMTPMGDADFNRAQSEQVRKLLHSRIKVMPYHDFVEMLRSAIKEDEWMLYAHGAVLGFGAGMVHLWIFGV